MRPSHLVAQQTLMGGGERAGRNQASWRERCKDGKRAERRGGA